ncbi:purine nucleosidase [Kribbella steppae]|uniref:Purine nucleosidase n=1 Tax=Kribbella steppae TaxID=2512223 RepID=A0A4R2HPU5_9ACTN|nr:nucleoside hydrolase [Kribbella steppae]TCO32896.1 purine nucleosidase [Kribbella steppae]
MNQLPRARTLIFDTDIGSDVDDAMALAQILGTPGLSLHSVTTVYGDTLLRARIARRYGVLADHDIAVHPGQSAPLSGRDVWWPGHEGSLHEGLDRESVAELPAVDHLIATLRAQPGEIDVIAVGPLTNIAEALRREPHVATWIRHLWIMGGLFPPGEKPEHNFKSDAVAARAVLSAGIPTTVTGLDVTQQVNIDQTGLGLIGAAGALGAALQADIRQWWEFWQQEWNVPHDPVAVLTLSRPDLFTFSEPGIVDIADDGTSTFTPDGAGTMRLAVTVEGSRAAAAIIEAIQRART